jgi:hypothetical protein
MIEKPKKRRRGPESGLQTGREPRLELSVDVSIVRLHGRLVMIVEHGAPELLHFRSPTSLP